MRFHALMLVRDEDDILEQTLAHLLEWADGVYIYDLGSLDHTWDIVRAAARRDPRVHAFASRPIIFGDRLRGDLFAAYRDRFEDGDWIVRADADEFYAVPPPEFVEALRRDETLVQLVWYFFRMTTAEADAYLDGACDMRADRLRPIWRRRRWFKIPDYAEPRMFRYRRAMQWPKEGASFPFNAGCSARARIPVLHFPHRDPLQMEWRYILRAAMTALTSDRGAHWSSADWRGDLLHFDRAAGAWVDAPGGALGATPAQISGPAHFRGEDDALPPPPAGLTHLGPWPNRMARRLAHRFLLGPFDRRRAGHCGDFSRPAIPAQVQDALRAERAALLARYAATGAAGAPAQ